jgi:hypothetical protein
MALEITIGPPRLAISQGYGVLITDQDGQIRWPTDKGFYHSDTRVISSWRMFADGEPWKLLNSGNIAYYANRIFLTNPTIHTEIGEVPEHTLSLSISRSIGGGIHEDLDLVNHGMGKVQFNLEIAVRSDFADIFEVKSGSIVRRGRTPNDRLYQQGLRTPGHRHGAQVGLQAGLRQRPDQFRTRTQARRSVALMHALCDRRRGDHRSRAGSLHRSDGWRRRASQADPVAERGA